METLVELQPADLRAVAVTYRDALRAHQEAVNRLNVYPVPDGDTGTNMALTLESVVAELDGTDGMPEVCKAISHGSLMGARGNSGVILCQVLRGLCDTWKEGSSVGAAALATSLRSASDAAYRAVMRPVEGTILTVAAAAATGAESAAGAGQALPEVLRAAKAAAEEALERTPELLAVLKQAGVVDAGGAGFVLLLDAFLHVVAGQPVPEPSIRANGGAPAAAAMQAAAGNDGTPGGPRFEVMYLLEAADTAIPGFKRAWDGIGDSIVIVGGEGTWNCHIHTDDIGAAIEAALDVGGRPRRIHVTDLEGQVEEQRWVREGTAEAAGEPAEQPAVTAVVAVASGAGVARIFRSLGAARVVAGGQSMNPSTAEILEAVDSLQAGEVVVLPNNSNITPVAEQVRSLTTKTVRVVPTRAVAEGMAALLDFDGDLDAEANAGAMADAARRITPGEITQAVRASSSSAGPIAEGDWLGLSATGIEVVAPTVAEAATGLLDKLVESHHELVTVLEGEDADPADTRAIHEWLEHNRPGVSTEIHDGGQPLYPFLFSIE